MTPDRYQRVVEIFQAASDCSPVARPAFLASACAGDDDLRREVEAMLAADAQGGGLLDKPADDLAAAAVAAHETRSLMGHRISHYEVVSLLGLGGMGEVYLARDVRLNRLVALKVLAGDLGSNPELKKRFEREARAVSNLNHPHICTVHDVGEEDGIEFIVMEYVSGQTLEHLIMNKGLPLKQAVKYGLALADAVVAAHEAHIIHRDIKPSNVMVTEEGRLKVLDFGLAKLAERQHPTDEGSTKSLTTQAGMIFGTAGYMSPEQAKGKPADARSDIFSFGALLYQMVTGRRAFPGDNAIISLAAVINHEPTPLLGLVPDAPPQLEWVIMHCLNKDPGHRIQHMIDVKIALEDVLERIESHSAPLTLTRPRRRWLAPALIAVLLGLAGGAWLSLRIVRKEPVSFQRLTFRYGDVSESRFAPNGTIVYSAQWESSPPTLFSAIPGNPEARDLELPSGDIQSVSSSGELALVIRGPGLGTYGTLAQVPLAGGTPRALLENVWSADWGPGGMSLAVVRTENGHHRVEYPIGTVLYETEALRPPVYLRVSRRGDQVTFFDFTNNGDFSLILANANRKSRVLSRAWRVVGGAAWSPNDKEIWLAGGRTGVDPALWAVDLSGRERLLAQIAGGPTLQDVARDGHLLVTNTDSRIGIRGLAPGATEEGDLSWLDTSSIGDISEDGSEIVFVELSSGDGRNSAMYLRRTDGSPAVRLGFGNHPSLSHDGKWVACVRRDRDNSRLLLLPTGAGEEKLLSTGAIQPESVEWFADGKCVLLTGNEPNQPPRTYVLDLVKQNIKAVTPQGVRASGIFPNGQFAAVIAAGKLSLHSLAGDRDIPVGAVDPNVSVIRSSSDGRYLFLQRGEDRRRRSLLRVDVRTGHQEVWRELKLLDPAAQFRGSARLSGDGKSYAFSFQRDLSTLYIVKGVK
jgi:serine/threonine protein kinase